MDSRIVKIQELGDDCFLANGKLVIVENKGTFFKAFYLACKDVSAAAYTIDEAIIDCYRKIKLRTNSEKFIKVNAKHHSK